MSFKVVVMGAPLSGKSSLLSYLAVNRYNKNITIHESLRFAYTAYSISSGSLLRFTEMLTGKMNNQQLLKDNCSDADLGVVLIPVTTSGIVDSMIYIAKFLELNPGKPIIYVRSKHDLAKTQIENIYSDNDICLSLETPDTVNTLLNAICDKLNIPFTLNRKNEQPKSAGIMVIQLNNELTTEEQGIIDAATSIGAQIVKRV